MLTPAFRGSYLNRLFFVGVFYCGMLTGFSAEHCTINQNDVVSENYRVAALTDLPEFTKKFNSLVSRAYFKLIVEAERADIRLAKEYKRLYAKNEDKMDDLVFQKEFTVVYKRFLTHRRMLYGLKSWRIFSEDRTGDLEYFKKEYRDAIYAMYRNKASDEKMVAFLMYRLADLYHLP